MTQFDGIRTGEVQESFSVAATLVRHENAKSGKSFRLLDA